jgi:hypothetical protein
LEKTLFWGCGLFAFVKSNSRAIAQELHKMDQKSVFVGEDFTGSGQDFCVWSIVFCIVEQW